MWPMGNSGYETIDGIERVHLRFLKHILNFNSSIPNFMVYGETNRFPLYINIDTRMVGFGAKLILCHENKICQFMYLYISFELLHRIFKPRFVVKTI